MTPRQVNDRQRTKRRPTTKKQRIQFRIQFRIPKWPQQLLSQIPETKLTRRQLSFAVAAVLVIVGQLIQFVVPLMSGQSYALDKAGSLLPEANVVSGNYLQFDQGQGVFSFNSHYKAATAGRLSPGVPNIQAEAYQDGRKGVKVTDPVNSVSFTLVPEFGIAQGRQDQNRIVYPLRDGSSGWLVYSMQSRRVKEDILLNRSPGDKLVLNYTLDLGEDLEARMLPSGGVGIYGSNLPINGTVAVSSDQDASVLKKLRERTLKTKLLFRLPRPVVYEENHKQSAATSLFSLDESGTKLAVITTGLDKAQYPLSIDPSIYVETAEKFMQGNNETNIDFDVANTLIQKGKTTGARFDSWDATKNLNTSIWRQGVAVAGGYIYTVGGEQSNGSTVSFTTPGTDTFTVPAGITSITVKSWGAGGGGGGGSTNGDGGTGGGGGFAQSTITVTPGEDLDVVVGTGGSGGAFSTGTSGSNSGDGGGGGGYSSVNRSSTRLIVAAGGGGGGGGDNSSSGAGGTGGAGGGSTGEAGGASGNANGGGGGTSGSGGSAGSGGGNSGQAGSSLNGGDGADGRSNNGSDGSKGNAGTPGGGDGGNGDQNANGYGGGGGGGAGYYGGGGGSGSQASDAGGGGGGGGSSYGSGTGNTLTVGSGQTPGNDTDNDRGSAGEGGDGGTGTGGSSTGTSGSNGIVIISYSTGTSVLDTVSWAKFNNTTGEIVNADPGSGTCAGWCTLSAYQLPVPRRNVALVAYNGFLFAIGGEDSSCTTGNGTGDNGVCNTIYTAKIGANGEPALWSPSSSDKSAWTYWYENTPLSSPRTMTGVVAYNNRLYILGGETSSGGSPSIVDSVEVSTVTATGKLDTWTDTGADLPTNLYGQGVQVYNGYLYIIGGASSIGGAPTDETHYIKIDSDGSLNSWVQTSSFNSGRMSNGGNFTGSWGGYIYLSGGCSTVNGSGYCTAVESDTQLASINADGSLDVWNTNASVSDTRMGHNIVTWRDYIYEIGGCTAQNGSTGDCTSTLDSIYYGAINQDGDASTVDQSVSSGTSPCSGGDPHSCNIPPAGSGSGQGGQMLSATAIMNGYLYVIGGCTNTSCSNTTGNVSYVSIASDGSLSKPSSCIGAYYGSWCVDDTNTVSGGIAAGTGVVFGGYIYVVGGLDGGGNTNSINRIQVNDDGSLSTAGWTSQTLTGLGATSVAYQFAYARANPSSAGTNPGNLYIFGGCTATNNAGCTGYTQNVYKCNIQTSSAISGCSTSGQLQIGTIPGDTQTGLGIMCGTVYANYIYLIGGVSPNQTDLTTLRYAKFDDSNNVVAADGGSSWIESPNETLIGRRRGAAFGYNGYIYVVGGYDGTGGGGVLSDIEFAKVDVSDGSIGEFQESAVTINQRWGLSVPVSNSFAYVIGGCNVGSSPSGCSSLQPVVQTFQIYNNDSGSPAGYSDGANLFSTDRLGAGAAIHNGYIYIAGGCTSSTDCTTATTNVQYAPIDANGNIGTWSNTTGALPAARAFGQLEVAGGTLYYIGGQSSTATDERAEVYYATPSGGNISSWSTASNGLPAARTQFSSTVWNNRIFVLGGNNTSGSPQSTVYVSPQLNSGGNITSAWSTDTSFNVARNGMTAISYANNLYVLGGYDGTNYLSDVQYTQINSDGSLDSWHYSTNLPRAIRQGDGFAANGYMYLFGGRSADTSCSPRTLVAPISANTTIATGNNPTGVGEWYETNARYNGDRYGVAAAYNEGKAYVLGGACEVNGSLSTQISDDFDANIDGSQWTSTGTTAANTNCASVSGNSLKFDNGTRTASTIDGDFTYGGVLDFYIYTPTSNLTNCNAAESGENIELDYSTNNGGSWTNIATFTPPTDPMSHVTIEIPAGAQTNDTRFRWNQVADSGNGFDNWSIDDVDIGAYGAPTFTYTGSDRVVQTTLLSQPQVAQYSIRFDTDTDVFPTKWLLNGVDNSIGAAWQASYQSAFDSNYVVLNSDFDNGTDGNNVSTVGTELENCYGTSSGTNKYSNTQSVTPKLSMKIDVASGSGGGGCNDDYADTPTRYDRFYMYFPSLPSSNMTIWNITNETSGHTIASFRIRASDGKLQLRNSTTAQWTSAVTTPTNTWIRVELAVTGNVAYARLYYGDAAHNYNHNGSVADDSGNTSTLTFAEDVNSSSLGMLINQSAPTTVYYDAFKASSNNWVGSAYPQWGQTTNFGDVTLGNPNVFYPLDYAGSNTSYARWYYFLITIDASQTFGYPEDVSRGPTIADLTLEFTSDPSKRLLHGKTFTGGLQQPLDTPF